MGDPSRRVYLLSPASLSSKRAGRLLDPASGLELAVRLRHRPGAALGEVFSFISSLYFRGKLTYADRFAAPPAGRSGSLVITSDRGLVPADVRVSAADLERMARVSIDPAAPAYREPLLRSARRLADDLGPNGRAVLLGSVASDKYVPLLLEPLGERLVFPEAFVGRGDMSRGGLLLRQVDAGHRLDYRPIEGSPRRGPRPPRLRPRGRRRAHAGDD